jgi:hypothetical protein
MSAVPFVIYNFVTASGAQSHENKLARAEVVPVKTIGSPSLFVVECRLRVKAGSQWKFPGVSPS